MNVLITSASRKVSLVIAFRQALAEVGGGKVIAVDVDPKAAALYFADQRYLVPAVDSPKYLETMLHLCRQLGINLLVPTRDEELPILARHKSLFADIGTTVMVPDPSVVETCQDKKLFLEFCQEKGFGAPKTYWFLNPDHTVEYPLFAKPRYGKGSHEAMQICSPSQLRAVLESGLEMIIQEFVDAPEYTVDLFADFTGRVISVVPRERLRIFGGESFVSKTVNNPQLIGETTRLARELGLVGHNTIQCFVDVEGVKFIEVNPRFGGAANLGFAAGAPTPLFLLKLLKGEAVEPVIGQFKDNYIMLRYTQDLFIEESQLDTEMFV